MIIGFAGDGHLMTYAFAAAKIKGFNCVKYKIGGGLGSGYHASDLSDCDIVYICPDRPGYISPQGMIDLVIPHLKKEAILVIHCQVEPGFTRQVKWPREQLYYHVETLKVSEDTMDRAVNPERIILGSATEFDGYLANKNFIDFLDSFKCSLFLMSYESAELTKIAINLYLAAQVCTTNTLSEIAKSIGADWNDIIPALQTDKRIGKDAYLKPGYGLGPHLERDLQTIMSMVGNTDIMRAFLNHATYRKMQEHAGQEITH